MALPKTDVLKKYEATGDGPSNPLASMEKSYGVRDAKSCGPNLTNVKVFNDYVAVLLVPIESVIAMPGSNQFSPVGIIVGIGCKCTNNFEYGQRVIINPKDVGIATVIEQGPEYEGQEVRLYLERNIFYAAQTGPAVNVKKPMPSPNTI